MRILLGAVLGVAVLAGSLDAQAQTKRSGSASPKHYRWEDESGRVHFSDTLPVEALRRGRTVYLGDRVVGQVERPLTQEEQAQRERQAQIQAQREQEQAQREREEELLRRSYPDEAAVRADFAQRKVFFEDRIRSSETSIGQYRRVLAERLKRAAELELEGKKVPSKLAGEIREAVGVIQGHQRAIERARQDISNLSNEEEAVLEALSKAPQQPAGSAAGL